MNKYKVKIAVLMTCHNRCKLTLRSIGHLFRSVESECIHFELKVFLVDDGSTDGTKILIEKNYPEVHIISGSGSMFWNGGMRLAFDVAYDYDYDYVLWLNDDTYLFSDALAGMLATENTLRGRLGLPCILVGVCQDPNTKAITYSGYRRIANAGPLAFESIKSSNNPERCDTMNGNCVLIPALIARSLGNLDCGFTHAMSDMDYGLRAVKAGFEIFTAPGVAGECVKNPGNGSWRDLRLSILERWIALVGKKGLPPSEWKLYTRRHCGRMWCYYWLKPYCLFWIKSIIFKIANICGFQRII